MANLNELLLSFEIISNDSRFFVVDGVCRKNVFCDGFCGFEFTANLIATSFFGKNELVQSDHGNDDNGQSSLLLAPQLLVSGAFVQQGLFFLNGSQCAENMMAALSCWIIWT